MTYDDLVTRIVQISGCPDTLVRIVIDSVPNALVDMEVDDQVRTPFGVFKMVRVKKKRTRLFGKNIWKEGHERIYVRLRPGSRMYREGHHD